MAQTFLHAILLQTWGHVRQFGSLPHYFFFQSQDPDEQQTQKEQKNSYTNLSGTADLGIFCLTLTSHIVSKECGIGPSRMWKVPNQPVIQYLMVLPKRA